MTFKDKMVGRHGSFGKFLFAAILRGLQFIGGFIILGLCLHDYQSWGQNNLFEYWGGGVYGMLMSGISIGAAIAMLFWKHFWPCDLVLMIAYAVLFGLLAVRSHSADSDPNIDKQSTTLAAWAACACLGLWGFSFCISLARWLRARRIANREVNEIYHG